MLDSPKRKKCSWRVSFMLMCFYIIALLPVFPGSIPDAVAQSTKQEGWYRLRTNSVPYQPQNVAVDSAGGLWVTAVVSSEYAPGVWYRPFGAPAGPSFQYLTNDRRNNLLGAAYNPPVEKSQLNAMVLYAVRDKAGNTWYALNNRKVLCEKAGDMGWLTFDMPDSSGYQPGVDTSNVDSAYRIRLIDKQDGSQEVLLIAYRGIVRVSAALNEVEKRSVSSTYTNDLIKDALIDSQGRYWVTSERGVEMGTSFVNYDYVINLFPSNPAAASGTMITRIVEDSLGNIWFGSDSYSADGIYCYTSSGNWIKYTTGLVNTIGKRVQDMTAGSNGSVWFGIAYYDTENKATGGILRYSPANGGQWSQYTQADLGLDSGSVSGLAFDGTGLWFVTANNPSITGNGTGVHYLTFSGQGQPDVTHYTYRSNSTTLTSLRFNYIAADRSGGVWFPAYDDSSIARLKANGSWQQLRQATTGSLGTFGFAGVTVDSKNRVYFAPLNSPPVAYDINAEQWLALPNIPFSSFYYYGAYTDPQDGKWFHGAYFVYFLDPGNTGWTSYASSGITPPFPGNYYIDGVLVDNAGNVWFMTRDSIVLMKKDPEGGVASWFKFTSNDGAGYSGGYRVYQDDTGQIWNASKQKFVSTSNTWVSAADTTAFDHRHLRFLNGTIPVDLNLTGALLPVSVLDERNMTLDNRGNVFFSGGLYPPANINAGIVAFGLSGGDVDRNGRVDLSDAIQTAKILINISSSPLTSGDDISGNGKIGIEEMIFILQRLAGLR